MEPERIVIVSLNAPREKVWGRLISLTQAGVTIQGIDLNSFEDWLRQVLDAQPGVLTLSTIFYPLHRVERIVADEPSGDIPSVEQQFAERVGIGLREYLALERKG